MRGFAVNRFSRAGIYVRAPGSTIVGNLLGTDREGTQDLGNGYFGVR